MLVRGRPLEEIVEDSGLTKEEVEAINPKPKPQTKEEGEAMTTSASHEDLCRSIRTLQAMKTFADFFSQVRLCLIKERLVSSQNRLACFTWGPTG